TVDAGEAGAGVVLVADGMEIALEAGSSVGAGIESKSKTSGVVGESSLEKEDVQKETEEKRGFSVQVLKGNAVVQSEEGIKVDVVEGQGIAFDKQGQSLPVLVVTNPLPNSKVLSTTEEKVLVPFKWNFGETKISENQKVYLTVAIDKDFENVVVFEDITNQNETQIQLDAEKYFWKVSVVEDATKEKVLTSQSGKLQIIKSLKPNQIVPAENASFSYRSRIPSIRFMWGEANQATSYKVEIATNPSMEKPIVEQRTNLTSLIISTLEFGNYYWRVTPYYTINNLGFANPSEVKSFSVERKSVLKKPSLYVPLDNGIVNTDEEIGSIAFSWKRESEAESYIVKIANNSELKNPFIIETTKDNFFTFDTKNVEKKLKDGKWFWSVTVQDFEGTLSEASDIRTFFAMKGKPEQHLIEPFDGFKVADSFVFDTKFTWKKNFPESFESYLQISKNQDFRKIEKEEKVLGNSFSGANLKEGVYYWRLKSVNTIDGSEFVTSGRKIDVVGNLAAANLIEPTDRIIARENVPCEFKWSEVSDASYYKLMIYKKSDNKLVLEDVIYDTEYKTDLFHNSIFEDKTMYRWELQAHANAIPGISSRRTGKIVEGEFLFAKLRPVSIDFPPKNYVLKGEDAILKPITAKWSSVDKVKSAQFVLRKVDEERPIEVIKIPTDEQMKGEFKIAPNKVLLDTPDGIKTGRYEIVVYAQTLDDIDISNIEEKYLGKFTVLPIEPLEQSKNLQVLPQSFDIEYLKNQKNPKTITFKWGKVSKATEYHFEIIDQKGKSVLSEIIKDKTSYL
ncbi:MAG: hypothetical protein IJ937_06680, partial [Treponema sp.]|nr:hypothetical protein [Treponema sp.]